MNRRIAVLPLTVAAGAAIAAGAGFAAGAGSSPAKPAARASQAPIFKAFAAYGDKAEYDLVPGGNFEPNTASWSLSGGAQVVDNMSSASESGTRALSLGTGASASSAAFPGGDVHTVRFFAQNLGASSSQLRVSASVDVNGISQQFPLGTVQASSMSPTPIFALPKSLQIELTRTDAPMRVTLTPAGQNSHWLIKDVYADPFFRCQSQC